MLFPYYGGKTKLAPLYPAPAHELIIEPFAGSAAYSLLHHEHDVLLIDRDPYVVGVWRYLISATKADILALPVLGKGERIDSIEWLSEEERWFLGYWASPWSNAPRKTITGNGQVTWTAARRAAVAARVHLVDHWSVKEGSYEDAPPVAATWFVDPPYQGNGGGYYRHGNKALDYRQLRSWIDGRNGQVIVCENEEADWLPLKPLVTHRGHYHVKTEMVWINGNA